MTTINLILKGDRNSLKLAKIFHCHYWSSFNIVGNQAKLTYICETNNKEEAIADVQDSIDIQELEKAGIDLFFN